MGKYAIIKDFKQRWIEGYFSFWDSYAISSSSDSSNVMAPDDTHHMRLPDTCSSALLSVQ